MGFGVRQTWARIPALSKALASSFLGPGSFPFLSLFPHVWNGDLDTLKGCSPDKMWSVQSDHVVTGTQQVLKKCHSPAPDNSSFSCQDHLGYGRWNIRAETVAFYPPQKRSTNNHHSSIHFFNPWLTGEGHMSEGRDYLPGWAWGAMLWSSSQVHVHHAEFPLALTAAEPDRKAVGQSPDLSKKTWS